MPDNRFLSRMEQLCPGFASVYDLPALRGIRINTLKMPVGRAHDIGFELTATPFADTGFYCTAGSVGSSPYHHAGGFYSQEPSAMSAVTVLDPQPGERVLDMCAAPGGKSTQIAAKLCSQGLLWSNEIVPSRAQVLVSNIERLGVRNAVVSCEHPERIAGALPEYFDRVLVDAPCSGEGMFRHDPRAVEEWSPEHSDACAVRQRAILDCAAVCTAPDGVLVYSTCTFAPAENELVIADFLERHEEFVLEPITCDFGRPGLALSDRFDLTLTRRIYPMDGGEGHFVARMRRQGQAQTHHICTDAPAELPGELADCLSHPVIGRCVTIGSHIYIVPHGMPDTAGLRIVRAGVLAGEIVKNRIEPAHAFFMSRIPDELARCVNLTPDDARLAAFLRGEQIDCGDNLRSWTGVSCDGIVTGFGKCSGGVLKNKYPKGLRSKQ